MSLPELSIRRPVMAWMVMAAILSFGLLSLARLGVSHLPDVDYPVVSISLNLPGANSGIMETQVVDRIEDAIMQVEGIRSVTSSAQQSSASIAVQFEVGHDIDRALQQIQNSVESARKLLPRELSPPSVRKSNPEDQPILWLMLTANQTIAPIDMMAYAHTDLYNQLALRANDGGPRRRRRPRARRGAGRTDRERVPRVQRSAARGGDKRRGVRQHLRRQPRKAPALSPVSAQPLLEDRGGDGRREEDVTI
jgi:hypothetical protein